MDEQHEQWMETALELASQAWKEGEVPVGCVFRYKDEIIARGRNQTNATKNATRHAELEVIDEVRQWCREHGDLDTKDIFSAGIFYVTVEPCIMCAAALRLVGARKVIFGCYNDRFGGCGSIVDVAGEPSNSLGETLESIGGCRSNEAIEILKLFYKGENPNAPVPKKKDKRE